MGRGNGIDKLARRSGAVYGTFLQLPSTLFGGVSAGWRLSFARDKGSSDDIITGGQARIEPCKPCKGGLPIPASCVAWPGCKCIRTHVNFQVSATFPGLEAVPWARGGQTSRSCQSHRVR